MVKVLNIVVAKIWGGGEQYVYDICQASTARGIKSYVAVDKTNTAFIKRFSQVATVVPCDLYNLACLGALRTLNRYIKE